MDRSLANDGGRSGPRPGVNRVTPDPGTGDRRTFLTRLAALGTGAGVVGLAGCVEGDLADDGTGPDRGSPPPLAAGLEVGVVSTALLGEVARSRADPDEPGGGTLVTVEDAVAGDRVTLTWRRTVEREVPPETPTTAVGVGTTTATPRVEAVPQEGTVRASGLADAHEPYLPIYFRPGETTTDTSAMWLSREAFRELSETRRTRWSRDVLTRLSRLPEEILERVRDGARELDEVYLHADPEFVDFELAVDGRPLTTPAIRAYDDFGNEYVVLADGDDPLIAGFTFDVRSTGFTGFDTAVWVLIKSVYSGYRVTSLDRAGG